MANDDMEGFRHPSIQQHTFRPKLFCSMLDSALGPALRPGHIIELVGEAGSGKTQLALHLSARSVIDKSHGNVCTLDMPTNDSREYDDRKTLYIATEGPFPIERLHQMIEGMGESRTVMDNIYIETASCIVSITMTMFFALCFEFLNLILF